MNFWPKKSTLHCWAKVLFDCDTHTHFSGSLWEEAKDPRSPSPPSLFRPLPLVHISNRGPSGSDLTCSVTRVVSKPSGVAASHSEEDVSLWERPLVGFESHVSEWWPAQQTGEALSAAQTRTRANTKYAVSKKKMSVRLEGETWKEVFWEVFIDDSRSFSVARTPFLLVDKFSFSLVKTENCCSSYATQYLDQCAKSNKNIRARSFNGRQLAIWPSRLLISRNRSRGS